MSVNGVALAETAHRNFKVFVAIDPRYTIQDIKDALTELANKKVKSTCLNTVGALGTATRQ